MKHIWPPILTAAGLALMFGGFIYNVLFAGIPYQDPTPEMSASYAHHAHIASVIGWLGAAVFLAGALAWLIRSVAARRISPPTSS